MSQVQVRYQLHLLPISIFVKQAGPLEENVESVKLGLPHNQHVQTLYKEQLLHQYSFIWNLPYFLKFPYYKL